MDEATELFWGGAAFVLGGAMRVLWPDDERYQPWDVSWLLGRHHDSYAKIGGALAIVVGLVMIWGSTTFPPAT